MKPELEKLAKQLLKDHPEQNVVFVSESGQAFFNKNAAENHEATRGEKVFPFFRKGSAPDTEMAETLEEVQEALAERKSVVETVIKVATEDNHGIEVSPATDEAIAEVVQLKEKYIIAKDALTEAKAEINANQAEIDLLKKKLKDSLKDTNVVDAKTLDNKPAIAKK